MRLFGFLMLHETFCPKDEKQKKHFTKTASLRARGQKTGVELSKSNVGSMLPLYVLLVTGGHFTNFIVS